MALIPSILENSLNLVFDSDAKIYPESLEDAAVKWSLALNSYASLVTPPSTTFELARQAFIQTFLGMNAPNSGLILFPQCFVQYAIVLSTGMQPAFTGVPPPNVPNFESVYSIGMNGGNSRAVISLLTTLIDVYFRTGTAINNTSGATINWN